MRTRYEGRSAPADSERSERIAAEEMDAARNSAPGQKWTVEQRKFFRSWRNYYPSLAYARNDPDTLYLAIDHAARKTEMNQVRERDERRKAEPPLLRLPSARK